MNDVFQHVLIMHIYICDKLVSLTLRIFFGVYLYDIMQDAVLQYDIVYSRSSNTKKGEAVFLSINTYIKL